MRKMKKRQDWKSGSSLMFVIIAIAFVGILATIVLHATLVNVQVKSQDKLIKKDFYSAESVMEMVEQGVQNMALECMAEAYTDMMGKYATTASTTSNQDQIQMEFARTYLNSFATKLTGQGISKINDQYVLADSMYSRDNIYHKYEQIVNTVDAAYIPNKAKFLTFYKHGAWDSSVEADSVKPTLQLNFSAVNHNAEKSLIIKNVQVIYTDDTAGADVDHKRSSEITTDIKIVVPRLSFASSSIYPEFTKYSIIGDDQVTSTLAGSNVNVNGYVYAGHNGLMVDKGEVTIGGNGIRVISRGDISVRQNGSLQLGLPKMANTEPVLAEVWTENYKTRATTGSTSTNTADLNVYAESYVHDDLSLDSPYSKVNFLAGNYYGYSFNKNNRKGTNTVVDSEYSSAIMINGKHSALSMSDDLKSILLGGRTFISRSRESSHASDDRRTTDIPMGQAVSIKCDQNFYKVAEDDMAVGFSNPMLGTNYESAKTAGQRTKYSIYGVDYETVLSETKLRDYDKYLDPKQPVTEIHYSLSNTNNTAEMVYFYYNFKNEDAADDFFNEVIYNSDKSKGEFYDKIKSSEYLAFGGSPSGLELKISPNLLAWTNSNFIKKVNETGMEVGGKTITEDNLQTYLNSSIQYASLYKSYQLTLTDGLASQFAQDAGTQGSDAFDLEKTELQGGGLDPDDRKVKNVNQLFGYKLITKENNSDEYKFVKEAASNPTEYGFSSIGSNLYLKAVKVSMGKGTSNGGSAQDVNGFAVFVACTDTDPSQSNVNMSMIQDKIQHDLGFSNADPYNRVLMVVSNCNVTVDRDVRGLVISDTVVKLYGTSVDMTADSASLQAMITAQKKLEGTNPEPGKFLKYFQCFADFQFGSDEDVENVVDISQYVSYQNWRKNDDTYE